MSDIQRYAPWPQEWPQEDPNGDLVEYEDHKKIVDALQARAERLEAALREIADGDDWASHDQQIARAALEPVAAPVALEAKMAALPQERQDRINAEADRLAALDDLARLGQEFDAETEAGGSIIQGLREALEYTKGMLVDAVKHDPAPDPAAIREAALREAIEAYPRGIGAILALIERGDTN